MNAPTQMMICPKCGMGHSAPQRKEFEDYFNGIPWSCKSCGASETLWDLCNRWLRGNNPVMPGIATVGLAHSSHISVPWVEATPLEVDLSDHGVPSDAEIVEMFLTPTTYWNGEEVDVTPDLIPGMIVSRLHIKNLPHQYSFQPLPFLHNDSPGETHGRTHVSILVLWIGSSIEPEMEPLLTATKAYAVNDFRGVVIPAQVTQELIIGRILTNFLSARSGQGESEVKDFLNSGATYGYQRKFLMPALLDMVGAPRMPEQVRANLDELKGMRNRVGHTHANVTRGNARQALLASLFGYWYYSIYEGLLSPDVNSELADLS